MADDWRVLPHGPLEQASDNLWYVRGAIPGMTLQRVMVVARMRDGRLVVHNAIAMDDAGMRALEALGDPAVLLVPSGYHRIDAPRFARRYPAMRVYCPYGSRERVAEAVRVDGTYEDFAGDASVRLDHVDGVGDKEGVMRVVSGDGTALVFNDILFNMGHKGGFSGAMMRLLGSSGGPRVTRIARLMLLRDPRALARRFVALAATPGLTRVLVAHEDPITEDPEGVLRRLALTL
jgi:hypothetical protein